MKCFFSLRKALKRSFAFRERCGTALEPCLRASARKFRENAGMKVVCGFHGLMRVIGWGFAPEFGRFHRHGRLGHADIPLLSAASALRLVDREGG
jgi:hypothetical protein